MGDFVYISATYMQTWSAKPVYICGSHHAGCLRDAYLSLDRAKIETQNVAFYGNREVLIFKVGHNHWGKEGDIVMSR
jgi:hypothetical protein